MLVDLFEHYLKGNFILLVATAESTSKLNQYLFMPRGNHVFKTILCIDELSKVNVFNTFYINVLFYLNILG